MEGRAGSASVRRGIAALGLLLILALAWGVRVLDAPAVFTREGIRAAGPDAYYHLRRVAWSYARFPSVLEHDPYLNYPAGGDVIWPPGLDWSVAATARLVLGADASPERLQRFALQVPVVLGVLAVAGTFAFAAWWIHPSAAWLASGLLALLPAHALYSRIGMLDHHATEALVTLCFLFAGATLVDRARRPPGPGRADAVAPALLLAFVIAGSLLIWPGSLLQIVCLDALLAVWVCAGPSDAGTRRLATGAALAHGLAAALLLPFAGREYASWGSFAPVVLGAFQPWLLSCAALAFACVAWQVQRGPAARTFAALALGLSCLAASAVAWPELAAAPEQIWTWLARDEAFQSQVAESLPLFGADPRGRFSLAQRLLSGAVLVFPIVLALRARDLRRRFDAAGAVLLTLAIGLGGAAIAQRRFANAFSVPFVLLLAWFATVWLPERLRARPWARGPVRLGLGVGAAGLVVLALLPCLDALAPAINRRAEHRAGRPLRLAVDQWRRSELHRLAEWMSEHTPETSGFLAGAEDASKPEYGILSHWSDGHVLVSVARRPAVVTNFGDDLGPENMVAMERYFHSAEAEASRILDSLGARYAVLEFRRQVPLHEFSAGSMISRAFFADGEVAESAIARRAERETVVHGHYPALERHRLVYESASKPWAPDQPFFKLYEHVAAARVEGRAEPGARVSVSLGLETSGGRRFRWRQAVDAGPDGVYRLLVPYATEGADTAVHPDPAYRVRSGDRERSFSVHEHDVQAGRTVRVPSLGSSDGSRTGRDDAAS